jgi:hypothetical protein
MSSETTRPVKVLYIAGAGRSGSTLLECALGRLPGAFAAGELTHIWRRGLRENQLCGCGEPFRSCPFWTDVFRRAFGGFDAVAPSHLGRLRDEICSHRHLLRLTFPPLQTRRFRARLSIYRSVLDKLYRAVRAVSGCELILDASKYPAELALLRSMAGIDLFAVHLVRNSLAVAYSWRKWKRRPEIYWQEAYFARYNIFVTALGWTVYNLWIEGLLAAGTGGARIRYEDFVALPAAGINRICRGLQRPAGSLDFLGHRSVDLAANHTVSGNPIRFLRGAVPLAEDGEWESGLPAHQRWILKLLTAPLRKRYGYH